MDCIGAIENDFSILRSDLCGFVVSFCFGAYRCQRLRVPKVPVGTCVSFG